LTCVVVVVVVAAAAAAAAAAVVLCTDSCGDRKNFLPGWNGNEELKPLPVRKLAEKFVRPTSYR